MLQRASPSAAVEVEFKSIARTGPDGQSPVLRGKNPNELEIEGWIPRCQWCPPGEALLAGLAYFAGRRGQVWTEIRILVYMTVR